jgi:hypothetical protein
LVYLLIPALSNRNDSNKLLDAGSFESREDEMKLSLSIIALISCFALIGLISMIPLKVSSVSPITNSCVNSTAGVGEAILTCSLGTVTKNDMVLVVITCEGCIGTDNPITNDSLSSSFTLITENTGNVAAVSGIYLANITITGSDSVSGTLGGASRSYWGFAAYDLAGNQISNASADHVGARGSQSLGQSACNTAATSFSFSYAHNIAFEGCEVNGFNPTVTTGFTTDLGVTDNTIGNGIDQIASPTSFPMSSGGAVFSEVAIIFGYAPYVSTTTVTAWNVPNGSGLLAGFEFLLALLLPSGFLTFIAIAMKSRHAYLLFVQVGLVFGSIIGAFVNVVPTALIFVFGGFLAIYIWKGRSSGAQTGGEG